jgi:hypothetical protein
MDCIIGLLVISIIIILLIDKSMECFSRGRKTPPPPPPRPTPPRPTPPRPTEESIYREDALVIPELQNILKNSTPTLNIKYQDIAKKLKHPGNKNPITAKLENITLQEHYNIINITARVSNTQLPQMLLPQSSSLPINPSSVDLKTLQMNANANKTILLDLMGTIFDINTLLDTKIKTINAQIDLLQSNLKQIQNNMPDTNINKQTINNNLNYLVNIKILPITTVKDYQVIINRVRGINISV